MGKLIIGEPLASQIKREADAQGVKYVGKFVAVHRQEVVDHDRDEQALEKRIRARFGKTAVYLTPAEGLRELRIVSTRFSETL